MRTDMRQVADNTYLVHGSNTNWVIVTEGDAATLVDTGYPGDRQRLLDSLAEVGSSPEAVAAVLITHAHNDHLGSAEYLRARTAPRCICTRPKCRTPGGSSCTR